MALQNISPINDQLADTIVRASEPWIETSPGMGLSAGATCPALRAWAPSSATW